VDISKRLPASHQLTMKVDSAIILDYKKPSYVLGGWEPEMSPLILSQPESIKTKNGKQSHSKLKMLQFPKRVINGLRMVKLLMEQ
jgi:hypothetical protein